MNSKVISGGSLAHSHASFGREAGFFGAESKGTSPYVLVGKLLAIALRMH
jgi:hypothetical protein